MHIDASYIRLERSSDGISFLFEEKFGFVYLLNDTGYVMAKMMLQGNPTIQDIAKSLIEQFELDLEEEVTEDIVVFVNMLREYDLIR